MYFHSPRLYSLRLASTRLPDSPRYFSAADGSPAAVRPVSRDPTKVSPVAGLQTPPATGTPSSMSPIEMHHSGMPVTYSRVPSSGSTIHTRRRPSRSGRSPISSDNQPSP